MTATVLARQSRNQKNRNMSRKDAKAAKKRNNILSELGVLRALAGQISESEMFHMSENSRRLRKLSNPGPARLYFVPSQPCSDKSMVTPSGPLNLTSTLPRFAISSVPG